MTPAPAAFIVLAEFRVRPERRAEFLALAFEDARSSLRDEPGCLAFDVLLDEADPNRVVFHEAYVDRAAFDGHLRTTHLAAFRAGFPALVVEQRPVRFLTRQG